ncbi:MAG TPA: GNAT family N-acetyltransferase, partial [Chryseolinea sp.]|nr:GNAT family N-acetyltransferase [Chryseolinea sp.]
MAITIRLLQNQEVELANTFFNKVYQVNRPIENFKWEFLDGPFGKAIYVIAVDETSITTTKIVGIQCAIPIELISSKGKIVLTAKSEDTLVDPAYRGQKIFERMYELLFDECRKSGIQYLWGFTPAQKAFERIGFEIPFKAEQALLVFNPLKAYYYLKSLNAKNTSVDKLKILGLSILSWIKGFNRYFISLKDSDLREVLIRKKNDVFQTSYSDKDYFTLNETDGYMKWRIDQNPFQNGYSCFQLHKNEKVSIDVILNVRANVAYLEQMFSCQNETAPVLASLAANASKKNVPLIRALCFSTNEELVLQGNQLTKAG